MSYPTKSYATRTGWRTWARGTGRMHDSTLDDLRVQLADGTRWGRFRMSRIEGSHWVAYPDDGARELTTQTVIEIRECLLRAVGRYDSLAIETPKVRPA